MFVLVDNKSKYFDCNIIVAPLKTVSSAATNHFHFGSAGVLQFFSHSMAGSFVYSFEKFHNA